MDPIERLRAQPERGAILLDVDGVLAPIVPRPQDARVPPETRAELRRLARRYALVACISGRSGDDARRVVAVPELVYVGNHGLELAPDAETWRARLASFLATTDWPLVEDKGLSAAFHYRGARDEAEAREHLEELASHARSAGFAARFGRKVLELVPAVAADKGTAVHALLAGRGLRRALYAGDDTTDLDAFAALDELEVGIRVAVASAEGPTELRRRADVVLDDTRGVLELLRRL